jgi:hypothetical protein
MRSSLLEFRARRAIGFLAMSEAGKTTHPGYRNRNGQINVRPTGISGTDHGQYIYVLSCSRWGNHYGANGSDIFQRKCPKCQGGAPGLAY